MYNMPEVRIQKGAPMPKCTSKYPFGKLEINEFFDINEYFDAVNDTHDTKWRREIISSAASAWGRRTGKKFSVRTIENILKCQRIA